MKDQKAQTKKPWHLHGKEQRIVDMRSQGRSWEEIAVLLQASKQGVIGAYNRFVNKKTPGADTP